MSSAIKAKLKNFIGEWLEIKYNYVELSGSGFVFGGTFSLFQGHIITGCFFVVIGWVIMGMGASLSRKVTTVQVNLTPEHLQEVFDKQINPAIIEARKENE